MRRLTVLLLAAPLALAAPRMADAQLSSSTTAPVDITADHTDFQANQCLSRWSGDAEALQENSRLRADSIDVYAKIRGAGHGGAGDVSCGETDRMEANGDVFYVTPTQVVRGDHAVYSADAKTILFTGQVVVARGKDVMAGTRLLIHTDTREASMQSQVTGVGKSGRVRAVLFPNGGGESPAGMAPPKPPPPRQHGA